MAYDNIHDLTLFNDRISKTTEKQNHGKTGSLKGQNCFCSRKETFDLRPIPKVSQFTNLNIRGPGISRFQIFTRFISDALLAKI